MSSSPVEELIARVETLEAKLDARQAILAKLDNRLLNLQMAEATQTAAASSSSDETQKKETFYITTAIHYTNGSPHIGHAYENITSDVIARYHRMYGRDVFYLTGTDEHGQKIAQTAEAQGITPQELCDKYSSVFQQLTHDLNMSNDFFIRTTSEKHKKFVQWIFQRALDNGDVYLGKYEGWYNVKEEMFVTEAEAQTTEYKEPATGIPYKKMQEESYFFRMSKYQERLVKFHQENPTFLQPEVRRQEILKRLEEPLQDLSCSRTTFSHGVPLPNDPKHVMYVWFDALSNYLSAIDYPDGPNAKYWPANVHIIGKDIVWFHTVIWPCILMSANLPLPKRVYAHGFVNAKDGTKMSKSIGNVVDPYAVIEKFGLESFRFFLVRGSKFGADMPFSEDDLLNVHNAELADNLGNLVHRTVNLCKKYNDGKIPECSVDAPFDIASLRNEIEQYFQEYDLQSAFIAVINALRATNRYLTEKEPWKMKENQDRLVVVRTSLEAIYVLAHFLQPVLPETAEKIFTKLSTSPTSIPQLSAKFDNLTPGTEITIGDILFHKLLSDDEKKKIEEKESQKKQAKEKAAAAKKKKADLPLFASLDIRVGVIKNVYKHPDSDKLYCEEIDVGDEELRPIASGLQKFYTLEQMQDRRVLVICNLKPAKLAGFKSHGMVLCASDESHEHVEFVEPPEGAKAGERVFIDSQSGEAISAAQVKKQKVWEQVSAELRTNDVYEATYKGEPIKTSAGACLVRSLKGMHIS